MVCVPLFTSGVSIQPSLLGCWGLGREEKTNWLGNRVAGQRCGTMAEGCGGLVAGQLVMMVRWLTSLRFVPSVLSHSKGWRISWSMVLHIYLSLLELHLNQSLGWSLFIGPLGFGLTQIQQCSIVWWSLHHNWQLCVAGASHPPGTWNLVGIAGSFLLCLWDFHLDPTLTPILAVAVGVSCHLCCNQPVCTLVLMTVPQGHLGALFSSDREKVHDFHSLPFISWMNFFFRYRWCNEWVNENHISWVSS